MNKIKVISIKIYFSMSIFKPDKTGTAGIKDK